MLGSEERTEYLLKNAAPKLAEKVSHRTLLNIIYLIAFVCTTPVAIFNPSIISMISVVSGVFVAFIVYLVPVYMFKNWTYTSNSAMTRGTTSSSAWAC